MAVRNRSENFRSQSQLSLRLPSPWREVFAVSCDALVLAMRQLKSSHAGEIRKKQNVAQAGASRIIDLEIERFIVTNLKKLDVRVLSEETGLSSTRRAKYFAILDPIDGTSMAIRGLEFYSISIACGKLENERILSRNIEFAVVNSPGGSFYGLRGHGSYFNGRRLHTSSVQEIKDAVLRLPQKLPVRQSLPQKADSFLFLGSTALEMCLVARGNIDAYVERKHRKIFDYAAAALIVQEAGGVVSTILGESLPMRPVGPLSRSTLIVASNQVLSEKIKDAI